jgi:hypothetical protein
MHDVFEGWNKPFPSSERLEKIQRFPCKTICIYLIARFKFNLSGEKCGVKSVRNTKGLRIEVGT